MFALNELLAATQGRLMNGKNKMEVKGISIDSRTIRPNEAFIAIKGNNFDGHDFIVEAIKKGASCVISEPETRNPEPGTAFIEVKDTTKALGDIARFQRQKYDIPVIAVTGSNGKTTAKEMLAWVLSGKFKVLKNEGTKNNQIGLPQALLKLDSTHDIAVLEIGTNHFGEVGYLAKICRPNIGIITNIGPSHLEYLNNLNNVFKEKYTLVKDLKNPFIAVLNADDFYLRKKVAAGIKKPVAIGCGIKNQGDFFASEIRNYKDGLEFRVNRENKVTLKTLGCYNIYNALAIIAVARIFGLKYTDIVKQLASFEFPQGRLRLIKLNRINFIDDTYNSNPLSLQQALDTLRSFKTKGRKIFVMGDMLELGNHSRLFHSQAGRAAAKSCDIFVSVGELSKISAQAARCSGFNAKNIFTCQAPSEARDILYTKILPGEDDVVLVKGSRTMKMEEVLQA